MESVSTKQLAGYFLKHFGSKLEETHANILRLISESPAVSSHQATLSQTEVSDLVVWWLFAIQILPVRNVFNDSLKRAIYSQCIKFLSLLVEKKESEIESVVEAFTIDYENEYANRQAGRFSSWLTKEIYGRVLPDPVLLISLDVISIELLSTWNWKDIAENYNVVLEKDN